MNARRFDDAARSAAAMPRRRSLLLLGSAGAAAVLAGRQPAGAASDARKRCKKQKKQCRKGVQAFCAQEPGSEQSCLNAALPCCQSCKVKAGVVCALGVI